MRIELLFANTINERDLVHCASALCTFVSSSVEARIHQAQAQAGYAGGKRCSAEQDEAESTRLLHRARECTQSRRIHQLLCNW